MDSSRSTSPALAFILGFTAFAAVSALVVGVLALAQDDSAPTSGGAGTTRTVLSTGTGTVGATPDQLRFRISVTAQADSTSEALDLADNRISNVIVALRKNGVLKADLRTVELNLYPEYGERGRIIGYSAEQGLQVTVRSLRSASKALSAATTAGGNSVSIGDLELRVSNRAELIEKAKARAVAEAKKSARTLAEAADGSLGAIVKISEEADGGAPIALNQSYRGASLDALSAKSLMIAGGTQSVTVTVQTTWGIDS